MRRGFILLLLVAVTTMAGCHKRRTLGNFTFKPGMTRQDFENEFGSPTKDAPHWIAYSLSEGGEVRLFFLDGPRGGTRTLSGAILRSGDGPTLSVTELFSSAPEATQPATRSASHP